MPCGTTTRWLGLILILISSGCSRSDFDRAEAKFADSLNYLELMHELLRDANFKQSIREVEAKIPQLMQDFERLRNAKDPISIQLGHRLIERYQLRINAAWNGIDFELNRLRIQFDSPVLLKLEDWLSKMNGNN